ncbi:MAG: hypothetical protein IKC76_03460, partial [Firmicutes bacterium]|nr:hypothetical protein [Bacillota bacterium]
WFIDEEDRQLQFAVLHNGRSAQTVTISYYARMTMEGEFTADAPYVRHATYADVVVSGNEAELSLQ